MNEIIGQRYRLSKILSQGNALEVSLAFDTVSNRQVVLKRLFNISKEKFDQNLSILQNESPFLSLIAHDNIVKVLDHVESGSDLYIVMEKIHGESLKQILLNRAPLHLEEFFQLAIQICSAISFIHSKNIIHGDIRPESFMVEEFDDGNKRVVLLNFGLSRFANIEDIHDTHISESFYYISPEQCGIVDRPITEKSDLYSLGVLFYELLTSNNPFLGNDTYSIIQKHAASSVTFPSLYNSEIPEIVDKIILKLLAKDPFERYEMVSLLERDLRRVENSIVENHSFSDFQPGFHLQPRFSFHSPEIIGRDKELLRFTEIIDNARMHRGTFLFLQGKSGVGKSRLLEELSKLVILGGGVSLTTKNMDSTEPYSFFFHNINSYFKNVDLYTIYKKDKLKNEIKEELGNWSTPLYGFIPNLGSFMEEMTVHDRSFHDIALEIFEATIIKLLLIISNHSELLLLSCDNIQLSDSASLSLLVKLQSEYLKNSNIICSTGLRDGSGVVYNEYINRILSHENCTKIPILNMRKEYLSEFIEQFFMSGDEALNQLIEPLYDKTAGNCFFMVDFLNLLIQKKYVTLEDEWHVNVSDIELIQYSDNLIGFMMQSLSDITENERIVLSRASIIGKEFLYSELEIMVPDMSKEILVSILNNAVNNKLIINSMDKFIFSHDISFEALSRLISSPEKIKLHEKAISYYESLDGQDSIEILCKLLKHCKLANRLDKCMQYSIDAGIACYENLNYRDGIDLFSDALNIGRTEKISDSRYEEKDIHRFIGNGFYQLGQSRKSVDAYDKALRDEDSLSLRIGIMIKISRALTSIGRYDDALPFLKNALKEVGGKFPGSEISLKIRFLATFFRQIFHNWQKGRCVNNEFASENSRDYLLQSIYNEMGFVFLWKADMNSLLYTHYKSLNMGDSAGVSELQIIILVTHVAVLSSIDAPSWMLRFLMNRSHRILDRCKVYLDKMGYPFKAYSLYLVVHGDLNIDENSISEVETALQLLESNQSLLYLQEVSVCAVQVYEFFGKFDSIDKLAHMLRSKGDLLGNHQFIKISELYNGISNYYKGDYKKALSLLQKCLVYPISEKDTLNDQYARLFIFKSLAKLKRLREACEVAEETMGIIKQAKQTHVNVMSRIYPFYADELLYAAFIENNSFALSKINTIKQMYKKSRKLLRGYYSHQGLFYRIKLMYTYYVMKNESAIPEILKEAVAYFDEKSELFSRGKFYYYYGLIVFKENRRNALVYLKKALVDFDICGAFSLKEEVCTILEQQSRSNYDAADDWEEISRHNSNKRDFYSAIRERDKLLEITRDLSKIKDREELLDQVVSNALELVGAEQGEVFLVNASILSSVASAQQEGSTIYRSSMGVVNYVYSTCKSILINDAISDPVFQNDMDVLNFSLHSILAVPMFDENGVMGVLYLSNQHLNSAFNSHDLSLIESLASQAAVAIGNVTLLQRTRQLRNYFGGILDSMPALIIGINTDEKIVHSNKLIHNYFPHCTFEAVGKNIWTVFPEIEQFRSSYCEIARGEKKFFQTKWRRSEDSVWDLTFLQVNTEYGRGVVLLINDVTESEKITEHLIQNQKMDAIANLVCGLAHDFNNILTGIMASGSYLQDFVLPSKELFTKDDFQEDISLINDSAIKASELVSQLLGVTRAKDVEMKNINIIPIIDNVIKICEKSFDKRIRIINNIKNKEAYFVANPTQVEQIVMNLAINASHSMTIMREDRNKWGGLLSFDLEEVDNRRNKYKIQDLQQAEYLVLSVADTGVGMNRDIQTKIYEPFFTTKEKGRGTGLGLSMVYNIMKSMKGVIEVNSTPNKGTKFKVYFPKSRDVNTPENLGYKTGEEYAGTATILFFEEDLYIQSSITRALKNRGYNVLNYDISETFKRDIIKKSFDLCIIDVSDSGMDLSRMISRIKTDKPGVPIVITTGIVKNSNIEEILKNENISLIEKPYTHNDILPLIHRLLIKKA